MDIMEDIRMIAAECGDGIDDLKAQVAEWEVIGLDVIEASINGDSIATRQAVGRIVDLMRAARLPRKAHAIPTPAEQPQDADDDLMRVWPMDERAKAAEARCAELQAANDLLRRQHADAISEMGAVHEILNEVLKVSADALGEPENHDLTIDKVKRLADKVADQEKRLREVEIHGARRIGGVLNEAPPPDPDTTAQALGEVLLAVARAQPQPDGEQAETAPEDAPPLSSEPKKRNYSPEWRAAQSERMKAMRAEQIERARQAKAEQGETATNGKRPLSERQDAAKADILALLIGGQEIPNIALSEIARRHDLSFAGVEGVMHRITAREIEAARAEAL